MEALRSLDTLEALEIGIGFREQYVPYIHEVPTSLQSASKLLFIPGGPFQQLLEARHPLLHRVLLILEGRYSCSQTGTVPVLWEKHDIWESRKVPHLEYWDLLCDKLDQV